VLHARNHHLHALEAEALLGAVLLGQEVFEAGGPGANFIDQEPILRLLNLQPTTPVL
jgi:hypothetical protein